MSTPESITVSLEKAKELKEAGWPQDDKVFRWVEDMSEKHRFFLTNMPAKFKGISGNFFAAPAAEEILRRLPKEVEKGGIKHCFSLWNNVDGSFSINYVMLWTERPKESYLPSASGINDKSLANAAASMWIYLKQHSLLSK